MRATKAEALVEPLTDTRRVCDLTPVELLEAALTKCGVFGWANGRWVLELHANDGWVRRVVPTQLEEVPIRVVVGRHQLQGIDAAGELRKPDSGLGSAA